jgi:hypothetical protein
LEKKKGSEREGELSIKKRKLEKERGSEREGELNRKKKEIA